MFTEDQLLPISALQHLLFCERQCALIHVERLWAENRLTVEGQHLHARAHEGPDEYRQEVIVARSLTLRSTRLGLYGMADVVELYLNADSIRQRDESGKQRRRRLSAMLAGVKRAVPIEYKRGKPKKDDCDRVQLAAQAICLEEMFDISIEVGHLYYGERHRRTEVDIDAPLRATTERAAARLQEMIRNQETPRALKQPKCSRCSLIDLCLPGATQPAKDANRFVRRQMMSSLTSDEPRSDREADAWTNESAKDSP
jgi:CRISPR-associated exonuclease Cas4